MRINYIKGIILGDIKEMDGIFMVMEGSKNDTANNSV